MAHSKLKKEIRELEKLRTFYKLKLDNMVSDLVYYTPLTPELYIERTINHARKVQYQCALTYK